MERQRSPIEAVTSIERREGERRALPRIVALMVQDPEGRVLCQRRASERHHGSWTATAGGHQLEGEDDTTTLVRETLEEIGLQPPVGAERGLELYFPGEPSARPSWIQLYTATVDDPILSLELNPQEVSEMAWVHLDELLDPFTYVQPEFRFLLQQREALRNAELGILLDMDDTIFPSRKHLVPIFHRTTSELSGVEPTADQVLLYHGATLQGYVERLNAALGTTMSYDEYRQKADSVEQRVHHELGVLPHDGLPQLLDTLYAAGAGLAVGTNSEAPRARRILDYLGLRRHFSALVGANEVVRAKPAPDMFLEASRRLGIPPERCIVFEDAVGGIEAARAAGMAVVAFDCGHHAEHELAKADMVVDNYAELSVDRLRNIVGDNSESTAR